MSLKQLQDRHRARTAGFAAADNLLGDPKGSSGSGFRVSGLKGLGFRGLGV